MVKPSSHLSSPLGIALFATCSCLLWGSAVPITRIGFDLWGISPSSTGDLLMFAGVRFTLAGLVVLVLWALRERRRGTLRAPRPHELKGAFVVSLFQTTGQYLPYYVGLAHATGVTGAIVQGVGVFVTVLVSCLVFRLERLNAPKVMGCLVGFAGILVADAASLAGGVGFTLEGEGLIVLATLIAANASPFTRHYSATVDPLLLCGGQFVMGGLTLTCIGAIAGGSFAVTTLPQAGVLCWLVMVSAVAYGLWSNLLAHNDVSHVAIFGFETPIFGVLLSLLLLGDEGAPVGLGTLAALVLVCIGIVMVNRTPESHELPPSSTT